MSGSIKVYALIIIGIFMLFLSINASKSIMITRDVFDCVRQTQINTIYENINVGDLIVNDKLSINTSNIDESFLNNFMENSDLNVLYKIKIVGVNEDPGAIAVSVDSTTSKSLSEDDILLHYENIAIIEEVKYE